MGFARSRGFRGEAQGLIGSALGSAFFAITRLEWQHSSRTELECALEVAGCAGAGWEGAGRVVLWRGVSTGFARVTKNGGAHLALPVFVPAESRRMDALRS